MKQFSSLSAREEFALSGTLSNETIESLLDIADDRSEVPTIGDVCAGFPDEDFLAGIIERLHAFSKRLRGENRADLLGIIESLDDVAQCTFNSADYGRSELRALEIALDKWR